MPCINLQIEPIGPVIELGVSCPASKQVPGTPSPKIYWIKAIVDTGCSHTAIHTSNALQCGLSVISKGQASTPGGMVANNIYHGDLFLRPLVGATPFEWKFPDRPIGEMVHHNPAFDALLGMDIISHGILTVVVNIKLATFCW
jgi:hypothetical protein